ncbi:MAG: hypothetical protein QHH13_02385, partial [Melioribacter sp.]|nr:hypothetical protein [Melioribacter sp.]
ANSSSDKEHRTIQRSIFKTEIQPNSTSLIAIGKKSKADKKKAFQGVVRANKEKRRENYYLNKPKIKK